MRFVRSLLIALAVHAAAGADAFAPLRVYEGTWHVTTKADAGKPETLVNQCAELGGKYFACGQTINGQPGGLLVIIPDAKPGHYFTQTIMPEGRATGRDELDISGDKWTFSSRRDQGGKTTFYRTVNTFTGRNHIHFEQATSTNGTDWQVQNSGDTVRVGPQPRGAR